MPSSAPLGKSVNAGRLERFLEAFMDEGFDIPEDQALVDEIVADKLLLDVLLSALSELTDEERSLIDALFYQDKSEREVARETGIHRNTLSYRKNKILAKLKEIIENMRFLSATCPLTFLWIVRGLLYSEYHRFYLWF